MRVVDLGPLREQLGLPAGFKGVVVKDLDPVGPAAQAGLKQGDVVKAFKGTAQVGQSTANASGNWDMDIASGGSANVVPAIIEAAKALATEQEICDVLRGVMGTYADPAEF